MKSFVTRPVDLGDVDAFTEMCRVMDGSGMTSLPSPTDSEAIEKRLTVSQNSFAGKIETPSDSIYMLAMEDPENGKLMGVSAVFADVGFFPSWRVCAVAGDRSKKQIEYSPVRCNQTEIGSMLILPEYRSSVNPACKGLGKAQSYARFALMANKPALFSDVVFAEFRAFAHETENGDYAPFGEWYANKFFEMSFADMDRLVSKTGHEAVFKERIRRGDFPAIHEDDLPEDVRRIVIRAACPETGEEASLEPYERKAHRESEVARHILRKENLRHYACTIGFNDGGPQVASLLSQTATAMSSKFAKVAEITQVEPDGPETLISNRLIDGFRATVGGIAHDSHGNAIISAATAERLQVKAGHELRVTPHEFTP